MNLAPSSWRWLLRGSLALVFLWFGLLKLAGVSPVRGIIESSYPVLTAWPILYKGLAVFEIAVGVGLLIPALNTPALIGMLAHLALATAGVLFSADAFSPTFPVLTVIGEFVVKNVVLIAAGIALLVGARERRA